MDFVKRRAEREREKKAGMPRMWQELVAAISEAVDSYNDEYGQIDGQITMGGPPTSQKMEMRLSRQIFDGREASLHNIQGVSLVITLDRSQEEIRSNGRGSSVTLSVETEFVGGKRKVVPATLESGISLSCEDAAEELITDFLFEDGMSIQPR